MKKVFTFILVALIAMSAAAKKVSCKKYDFKKAQYVTVTLDLDAKQEEEYKKLWSDVESLSRELKEAEISAASYNNQRALGGALWMGNVMPRLEKARKKLNAWVAKH